MSLDTRIRDVGEIRTQHLFDIPEAIRTTLEDPVARYSVDPSRYYFRTNPLFETGSREYAWMNDIVCVGSGYLIEGGIAYRVSEVL